MKFYELLVRKQTKLLHQRNDCVLNFIAALTLSVVERKKKEGRKKKENEQAIWINAVVLFYICTDCPFSLKYQYN